MFLYRCHLALGEISSALQYFKESLPQGADQCLDRELVIDASKGMEKAKVSELHLCFRVIMLFPSKSQANWGGVMDSKAHTYIHRMLVIKCLVNTR